MTMALQRACGMEIVGWLINGSDVLACGVSTDGPNRCHACMSLAPCVASGSSASMRSIRIECVGHEVLTWLFVSCGCKTLGPFRGKFLHRRSTQAGRRRSVVPRTRWRRAGLLDVDPEPFLPITNLISHASQTSPLPIRRARVRRSSFRRRRFVGGREETPSSPLSFLPSIVWVLRWCFCYGFGWVVPLHVWDGRETVGERVMAAIAQPTMQQVRIHASTAIVAWDGRTKTMERGCARCEAWMEPSRRRHEPHDPNERWTNRNATTTMAMRSIGNRDPRVLPAKRKPPNRCET